MHLFTQSNMWICNFNQIFKHNHIASKAKGLFNEC